MYKISLTKDLFQPNRNNLIINEDFQVDLFTYDSGIEAIKIKNECGYIIVLPYMGQIIWDVVFNGHSLTMKNMFSQPLKAQEIVDTYGCFAFHSGLLTNGCPSPQDIHPLHGEMPCADMDEAFLEITDDYIKLISTKEYVRGFGHHYIARPSVTLWKNSTSIDIQMAVQNLSKYQAMPLQYMCHMNYAYVEGGHMTQNIPDEAFQLRTSIPDHVQPTEQWKAYMNQLSESKQLIHTLNEPQFYDPEIVFFADQLQQYAEDIEFYMDISDKEQFFTKFSSQDFNYTTRWILYNEDQQVGAFALPATCRPEGYLAAKENGSLLYLAPGEEKTFSVTTGLAEMTK